MNLNAVKEFAMKAHARQVRKYTGEPYWTHVHEVAHIVAAHGGTGEMVAAAYLHDTVEDTDATLQDIEMLAGPLVASYVFWLTDAMPLSWGNRAARKAAYTEKLEHAPSAVHTIKLADIISNMQSIVERDPDFAKVFVREVREMLSALDSGNRDLFIRVKEMVA